MQTDPFKEYLKQQEPDKKYKGYAWQTAIGLQAVDGLKPSEYLVDAAIQNIEGKITLDEVKNLLDSYYEEKPQKNHDRTEEADKVSIRIAKILSEHAFSANISFVASNPSVRRYLIKNTAVVLVFPSPNIWICHKFATNTAR